jgi:APA family basic amino acid/polyamine antiporter
MNELDHEAPINIVPLKRVLGLSTSILLVAGIMIGSGVFKKIAPMAALGLSVNYLIAAWIVAGLITLCGALVVAGLANLTEESGGIYEYIRISYGRFLSFLYGWTAFTIIGSASVAALAFIFAQSVNALIPLSQPFSHLDSFSIAGFIYPAQNSGVKLLAITAIILLTIINYRGVKHGANLNAFLTWGKMLGILFIIIAGLSITGESAEPGVERANSPLTNVSVYTAFFGAMLSAFWAYDGWADVSFVTGEIKNPKRNVPIAVVSGVFIVMLLYVMVNAAYMKALPLRELAGLSENDIAAAAVAESILGNPGRVFVLILIMISTFGSVNVIIFAYPRVYMRMAQQQSFFRSMAVVHPKFRTPSVGLIAAMLWSIVLVITGTFDMLTDLIIFSGFFFYIVIAAALIKMKRNKSITSRIPGYPLVPVIIIIFALALLINTIILQPKETLFGLILMFSGVPLYFYFKTAKKKF